MKELEKKRVGVDCDGTLTALGLFWNPSIRMPWFLFIPLIPITLLVLPDKKALNSLRMCEEKGYEIFIITARPKQVEILTRTWLRLYRIPHTQLVSVGFGKGTKTRKLEVLKANGIREFYDKNPSFVEYLRDKGIDASCVLH